MDTTHPGKKDRTKPWRTVQTIRTPHHPHHAVGQAGTVEKTERDLGGFGSEAHGISAYMFQHPSVQRERRGDRTQFPGEPSLGTPSRGTFQGRKMPQRSLGSDAAALPLLKNPILTRRSGLSSGITGMSSGGRPATRGWANPLQSAHQPPLDTGINGEGGKVLFRGKPLPAAFSMRFL